MAKQAWKPWHEVVKLREDLRSGELPLRMFAADLYEVVMQNGVMPQYERPDEFFALTYPTSKLRGLARDVVFRLAGKNDKAVRQLELTYGERYRAPQILVDLVAAGHLGRKTGQGFHAWPGVEMG